MKCPVCRDPDLVMADRQGIEIDYCPQCRGIWLDRGELDKLIERSAAQAPSAGNPQAPGAGYPQAPPAGGYPGDQGGDYGYRPDREHRHYDDDYRHQHGKHYKKKRGFLGDIFDFD